MTFRNVYELKKQLMVKSGLIILQQNIIHTAVNE